MSQVQYTEDNIRSLDWKEHIRLRPGMYIGKLGNGSSPDDGIYILLKEILDNSIDEYVMGHGKKIQIVIEDQNVKVRDYGRGIPLGKVIDCVSKINTGGKYDSKAFKKSVGLNGVGTKAVNALSEFFEVQSYRDGKGKKAIFKRGDLVEEDNLDPTKEKDGTFTSFNADPDIFPNFEYADDIVEEQLWNYAYLNAGLILEFNGKKIVSENGLLDLLNNQTEAEKTLYPPIHLKDEDIEFALTHGTHYGEQYHSFVNGQNTTQGGTHLAAFREAVVATFRNFYNKNYEAVDIRTSIIAAISLKVEEPVFESQTKTKLGSTHMAPDGVTVRTYVNDKVKTLLDNYLHRNPDVAEIIHKKIKQSERERKEIAGIKKLANKRAKTANLHNKKLRDCRQHRNDSKREEDANPTMIFITEGDSASGSLTKARDVATQAIFSLRGKPLNCYGLTKKIVYENEEFNLLQHALNIEEGIEGLRYDRVIIATDADVDGMHIRLLLLTFFLQFFPDLVREGHLFILETPLFRVRDKQKTIYCYSEQEKQNAIKELRGKPEITRFKGLGEISPDEFGKFIGDQIHLEPVRIGQKANIDEILDYYMGKNSRERQEFIIDNLKVETNDIDEASPAEPAEIMEEAEI